MPGRKVLKIAGITLAALVVVAAVGIYALSRPAALVPYHEALDPDTRDHQTQIAFALDLAGVNSSLVIVRDGSVLVMYGLPENSTSTPEDWQRVVLGATAPLAPETTTLVARQFVDDKPSIEWRVATDKVLAYQAGTLSAADLENAVTKTTL